MKLFPFVIPNRARIWWFDEDGQEVCLRTKEGKPFLVRYSDGDKKHLHEAVLVENISVTQEPKYGTLDIEFDFLCPNCGNRHWMTETACMDLFSCMGIRLACGWVSLRFPWAVSAPMRDEKSVYGQVSGGVA